MKLEIATPQKGTSWPSLISDIDVLGRDNGKPFPIEKAAHIRSVITSDVKPRFPTRVYEANKTVKEGKTVLWVWLKELDGIKSN